MATTSKRQNGANEHAFLRTDYFMHCGVPAVAKIASNDQGLVRTFIQASEVCLDS